MRRFILSLFLIFAAISLSLAQELTVKSFKLASSDLTAQTQPRKDLNNKNCALIKVGLGLQGAQFEGSIMGNVENKTGEYWVYMPQGNRMLKVKHANYAPVMVTFADYGVEKVESNRTYELTITASGNVVGPVDAGGNFYALTVSPKDAKVSIDGVLQSSSSDGEYSAMLPYGNHTYKVEAGGYISKSGSFTISSSDMTPINVSLVSAMATVSVTCPTPAVSLYVDKKSVGMIPWTGSLKEGMHLIEVKKEGYRSQQRTINLSQQQKLDVAFNELAAIQGNLSVNYKPFGADVYVDGKKVGQTPRVFNGLLVGNHKVEIKKDGYGMDSKTVNILEGQTATLSGVLTTNTIASTSSISTGSSLSGNTITIPVKKGISIEMVRVEAGTFIMGATPEMKESGSEEMPAHQVTLTNDFYIGRYEVTQALWKAVMGNNPSYFKGINLPVEQVSMEDCQEFLSKLNIITGKNFRLPTEAEWEYAACGGKKSRGYQYSGSNNISAVAWYKKNSRGTTHPVGSKQANELGIYDMTGNVWELCQDWKGSYSSSPQVNPTGAVSGIGYVSRGGSQQHIAWYCRSLYRNIYFPGDHFMDHGLRLVLSE